MSEPYLALDLWMALDLPSEEFAPYFARNGWADTWANLLAAVRAPSGTCGEQVDGEFCVLGARPHTVHYGRSDVGSSEPLPARRKPLADGLVHITASGGGWTACDTAADWSGSDTIGVTCPECLEATR